MRNTRYLRVIPVLLAIGGCQVIADLTVPSYVTTGAGGAGGATSTTSGPGGSGGSGASGGAGGVDSGQGGDCTVSDAGDELPPCLEHLRMWFVADDDHLTVDGAGNVVRWDDASSFGWVAKPAAGALAKVLTHARGSRSAVHLAKGGMNVVKDRVLHLPAVGVYAAIRWETFSTIGGATPPYGVGELFCLGSDATKNKLETYVVNENPAQAHMPGVRYHANVKDQSGASNNLLIDQPFPEAAWDIYGAAFACGDACLAGDAGVDATGSIFKGQYTAGPRMPFVPVSLDRFVSSWTYKWNDVRLGASCGDAPAPNESDIDLGEILLYDTYLDEVMTSHLTQYLALHWTG